MRRDGLVDPGGARGAFHKAVDGALCQWAAMAGSEHRVIGAGVTTTGATALFHGRAHHRPRRGRRVASLMNAT